MGLEEELKRIDEEEQIAIEKEKLDKEMKKKKELEDAEKQEREGIVAILESQDEELDKPAKYLVKVAGGWAEHPRVDKYEIIMTEREKKLAELKRRDRKLLGIDLLTENLSEGDKIKCESIEKRVKVIKDSEEGDKRGILVFNGKHFIHEIETSLKYALLSSMRSDFKTYEEIEEDRKVEEVRKAEEAEKAEKGKLSFASIKKSIQKVLGKER